MKVPLNWLKEYVEVPKDVSVVSNLFTAIGHMQDHQPEVVAGDTVLDLEVRQNRSDCLSILGLALELSAVSETLLKVPSAYESEMPKAPLKSTIEIKDEDLCYRFDTVTIEGVSVKDSPEWLKNRLEAYGIKPINNVVDITNYVMVEIGEPLHAFDLSVLQKPVLIIRRAEKGEKLVALNGKLISLTNEDLVVATEKESVALAGIIGGTKTSITSKTTRIIIEAATYNQAGIRRTSLRHNLRTEASLRHEKFLHPYLAEQGLKRAIELVLQICGGKLVDHTDCFVKRGTETKLTMRMSRLNELCGIQIPIETAESILSRLGFDVSRKSETELECIVPYYRTDVSVEEDVIEEVLRIYGYEKIVDHLPCTPPPQDIQSKSYEQDEVIRNFMIAAGFDEQITEPLVSEMKPNRIPVVLQNSLNVEKSMLRTSLKRSLLIALEEQKKYRKETIQLFEIGKIYYQQKKEYKEEKTLSGILYGKDMSFSRVRGVVDYIFNRLGFVVDESLVTIETLGDFNNLFFFEILIDRLHDGVDKVGSKGVYTSPPQVILEDLSVLVPSDCKVGELITALSRVSKVIMKISLGEEPRVLKDGLKSVFLHVVYHDPIKTLSSEDTKPLRDKILKTLREKFGGELRS